MRYSFCTAHELRIEYSATTTDDPTVTNLTNHAYFNLAGEGNGTILGESLHDQRRPLHAQSTPSSFRRATCPAVAGTPFDFRTPHAIGERIDGANDQLKIAERLRPQLGAERAGRHS